MRALPTDVLTRAGLSTSEVEEWALAGGLTPDSFEAAAAALSGFLVRGQALGEQLLSRP